MSKGNVGDRIVITKVNEHLRGATPDVGVCGKVVDLDFEGVVIKPEDEDETYYIFDDEYELVGTEKNLYGEVIQWQVGQEVWCLLRGKGVVYSVESNISLWTSGVTIYFENHGTVRYNIDGKVYGGMNRCLYFSEPKIIAEIIPPEKPFIPIVKSGELVLAVNQLDGSQEALIVALENKECVVCTTNAAEITYLKSEWKFYKVGEQVKFN